MTPPRSPQAPRVYSETISRLEPVCEAPADPCITVHRLVEDPITRSSYIEESRECFETFRRVPDTRLFERLSPELRRRLEQLNHRHGTLQRRPQATPRTQQPPTQQPPTQLPPAAPPPQASSPSPGSSAPTRPAPHASTAADTAIGAIVGIAGGSAARAASRVASAAARAIRHLLP